MSRVICIGGASSSGTTLVADLVDSIPGVGCPPELYIFSDPAAYRWDDAFVASVLARRPRPNPSAHVLPHPWFNHKHLPHCGFDEAELDALIRSSTDLPTFTEGFRTGFEAFRQREMPVLAEKTPINVNCAEHWCDQFPDGLFVHVVRHPWAVINSLGRRGYPPMQAAMIWICQVKAGLLAQHHPHAVLLRYEDLLDAPFARMTELADRVGIATTPDEIERRYKSNTYRAGLGRVADWSVPTFDGTIGAPSPTPRPPDDSIHWLPRFGAENHIGDQPVGGWLSDLAEELGYELGASKCPPPAELERRFATAYAAMLSSRRRGTLLKPVDPKLRRDRNAPVPAVVRSPSEKEDGVLRVLHGPLGQAGQPDALARALRRTGVVSASCTVAEQALGYHADLHLQIDRSGLPCFTAALRRIARDFDVIHLHGSGLASSAANMPLNLDLLHLRLLGARVIWHCRGTDSRLEPEFRRLHPDESLYDPATFRGFAKSDAYRRARVLLREAVCDEVLVVDEEMRSYVPDAEIVHRAIDLDDWTYVGPAGDGDGRVVVLHAPSREIYKGTEPLESAIAKLKAEGLPIEYRRITGLPNAEARREYARADIVVDQLMIGWYGVLAVEAMALGKPVIAWIRPDLERAAEGVPIHRAGIHDIADRLRELILDRDRRHRLGREARAYVERVHDSNVVAARLLEIYRRPRRPLESLDWTEVWRVMGTLAGEATQPLMDTRRELNQEIKRLRKELARAEQARSGTGALMDAVLRRLRRPGRKA
ncbi:MAG: hypothetical protein RLZZ461_28 [Planctomycetota bacterium]|jgi:hypothetical protein